MPFPAATSLVAILLIFGDAHAQTIMAAAVPVNDQATITLPAAPTGNVNVADADYADEGTLMINGNPVVLFGANAAAANNGTLAWTTDEVPGSYWQAGANSLAFSYTRHANSYRVDLVQIRFQAPGDMPVVQMLKSTGRAPSWLSENDDIRIRLRRSPDRVYMCARENGSASGRRFLAWSPGDQVVPDLSQPLALIDACDTAFCFAVDDATGTRDSKVTQACGATG